MVCDVWFGVCVFVDGGNVGMDYCIVGLCCVVVCGDEWFVWYWIFGGIGEWEGCDWVWVLVVCCKLVCVLWECC